MLRYTTVRSFKRLLLALCCVLTGLTAAPRAKAPDNGKHDAALDRLIRSGNGSRVRVIVRASAGQRDALGSHLREQSGHDIQREHQVIDAFTVDMPLAAVNALENHPFVASVSIDAPVASNQSGGGTTGVSYLLRPTLGLTA